MIKKVFLIFVLALGSLFLAVVINVKAAPWGTEGVPNQPSGGTVCDHHASSGSCPLYVAPASSGGQAWQGHFSANFVGTAGFVGPGTVTVTGCLSENTTLYSAGSSCWTIYNKNLSNSSDTFSDSNQFNIGTDSVPKFKYWLVNIYGDESYAYNIQYSVDSRLVKIIDYSAPDGTTFNTGQQFRIKWDTENVDVGSGAQISWVGPIAGGNGSEGVTINAPGSKTFTAGSSPGKATVTLKDVCGPSADGRICLDPRYIDITVVAAQPPTGTIVITSKDSVGSPLNSTWSLSGAKSYPSETGSFITHTNAPTGTYAISPNPVNCYSGPVVSPGSSQTLGGGQTVTFALVYTYSCGGPPPSGSPTCAASPATVIKNSSTTITADGGDGIYSWSGGGSPATGAGSSFVTSWPSANTYTVTVTSGGKTGTCSVAVTDTPTPVYPTPTCSVSSTNVKVGDIVTLTGASGDGSNYSWYEGVTSLGVGQTMPNSWSSPGTKNVEVRSAGKTGNCLAITVNPPAGVMDKYDPTGFLDGADCSSIGGWTWDQDTPNDSITFEIYDGSTLINSGTTTGYRPDVNAALPGNVSGNHGFTVSTPASVKDGLAHGIRAFGRDKVGKSKELSGSPKSVTCTVSTEAPKGTVQINSNNQSAAHYDTAPNGTTSGWNGNRTISNAAVGNWCVAPDPVPGYSVSPNACQSLTANNGVTFTITYSVVSMPLPGSGSSISDSCTVTVATPPPTPTPTPTPSPNAPSSVIQTDPNYCTSGPGGFITWSYSDPSGSPQTAYQIQITNTGSFNSPMYDSGKLNSSSKVFAIPNGVLQFNTTYKARVRTWNSFDVVSGWSSSTNSWKTPPYAYPQTSFTWSPSKPAQNIPTQFTDATVFGGGNSNSRQWSWVFGDGATSTQQSPNHTYTVIGNYQVTEIATDAANQSCGFSHTFNIQKPIPIIKEVAPK